MNEKVGLNGHKFTKEQVTAAFHRAMQDSNAIQLPADAGSINEAVAKANEELKKKQLIQARVQGKDFTSTKSEEEMYKDLYRVCAEYIACLNEVTDYCMINAKQSLIGYKWFRQTIKRDCNAAQQALKNNISHAILHINKGTKDLYLDFVDAYNERMKKMVTTLYWAVRNVFTRANYGEYADMLSQIETTRMLLGLTCTAFCDVMEDGYRYCRRDFTYAFSAYNPAQAYYVWDKMCRDVYAKVEKFVPESKDVNMRTDKDVKLAYTILFNALSNGDNLGAAAFDCLEQQYDSLSEEEKEEFDKIKEATTKYDK